MFIAYVLFYYLQYTVFMINTFIISVCCVKYYVNLVG